MTQSNPFSVTCQLCGVADDVRKMATYKGKFYHKVKTKSGNTTCIVAMKKFPREG